ncbi:uncharacterized protein LOC143458593 [Clavelina lepadiformis]|uniref:NADP-dependent oxidoreductase domain-containing protein n=1 Tax=Clavelina lepadiformis TaxID=159417 RepID=A0ABP0GCF3_CLALP
MALIPLMPTTQLKNGLQICKVINGMWQVSGAHGSINAERAVASMNSYAEMGFTTFDMADIYGPAEDIFGSFMKLRDETLNEIQGLTKLVPRPGDMSRTRIEAFLDKSMRRMQVSKIDCLQFHWWDYNDKRYLDALRHLSDLQKEGKIGELSLTNFDTEHLREVVESGVSISSNQIQYSVIDQRPSVLMKKYCEALDIKLLAYGTLCGGLISEKYLKKPEPKPHELNTASLGKYKHMIDLWGGWDLFQEMLDVLNSIAQEHSVSIANIATRYILDEKVVGGVIVGCRFGADESDHSKDNFRSVSASWQLTSGNLSAIKAVCSRGKELMQVIGDCGAEYR